MQLEIGLSKLLNLLSEHLCAGAEPLGGLRGLGGS